MKNDKICYILSYHQVDFFRSNSLIKALEKIDNVILFTAINKRFGLIRYFETLIKLIKIRCQHDPYIYILGFRGHEIFWFVRLITFGRILIFDSLISPTASLLEEEKFGKIGKLAGKPLFFLEKFILHQSNYILTDTKIHVKFLSNYFKINPKKIYHIPVGADETHRCVLNTTTLSTKLEVLFYGSFLPLHGMNIMLEAVAYFKDQPIHFTFIGGSGNNLEEFNKLKKKLCLSEELVTHIKWVTFYDLLNTYIPKADLGLGGPFGNTPQSQRVITSKTSQLLAMAKPTIVGKISEPLGFLDKQNCILVEQGNVEQLVKAIEWANKNRDQLANIGCGGLKLYKEQLSVDKIAKYLKMIFML